MPKIQRWFPCPDDMNNDPEVWELTETFGDWTLRIWLQILAIANRNDDMLMGTPAVLASYFAQFQRGDLRKERDEIRRRFKGTTAAQRAEIALYWMCLRTWLTPMMYGTPTTTRPLEDGTPAEGTATMLAVPWPRHAEMVAEWSMNRDRICSEWGTHLQRLCTDSAATLHQLCTDSAPTRWPYGPQIIGFKIRNPAKSYKLREKIKNRAPPLYIQEREKRKLKIKEKENFALPVRPESANRTNGRQETAKTLANFRTYVSPVHPQQSPAEDRTIRQGLHDLVDHLRSKKQ